MEWLQALQYKFWITKSSIAGKVVFVTLMGPLFCIAFDSWSDSRIVRWFFAFYLVRRCYDYKENEIIGSLAIDERNERKCRIPYSFYFGWVLHLFILLYYFGFLTIFKKFDMILCLFLFAGVRIILMEFI